MGFESFRVELRPRHATFAEADEAVRRLPHACLDEGALATRGSSYYTVEDGTHVLEVEVAPSPVRVSCRFTLCHPPSVDSAFLGLIRELMRRLDADAVVCDDTPADRAGGHAESDFQALAAAVTTRVAARRAEWDATFGAVRYPARTAEAFERYILPRCAPVAEPARVGYPTAGSPAPTVPAPRR